MTLPRAMSLLLLLAGCSSDSTQTKGDAGVCPVGQHLRYGRGCGDAAQPFCEQIGTGGAACGGGVFCGCNGRILAECALTPGASASQPYAYAVGYAPSSTCDPNDPRGAAGFRVPGDYGIGGMGGAGSDAQPD